MRRLFKNKKLLIVLSLILFLGFFIAVGLEAATPSSLEVNWPTAPGGKDLDSDSMLVDFVEYCYRWGTLLGGLAVFIALIISGFKYLTSVGDPGKMKEARERIFAAIAGLILLLSTYLVLHTINPELTTLAPPTTTVPGLGTGNWAGGELYEPCKQVTLYENINFQDAAQVLTKADADANTCFNSGWAGWWIVGGWGGVKVRSAKVEGACQVNIYEGNDCSGPFSAIGKSQGNLDWAGIDVVHSLEITDITPPGQPLVDCCCPAPGPCPLMNSVASGTGCYVTFQGIIPPPTGPTDPGGLNRNDGLQVWFEYADDENIINIKGNAPDDYRDRETIYEMGVPFNASSDNLTSTIYYWRAIAMGAGFGFSATSSFELDSSCNVTYP